MTCYHLFYHYINRGQEKSPVYAYKDDASFLTSRVIDSRALRRSVTVSVLKALIY